MATPPSPHAVLVPYPAQGHINPFMQLAKQLALHGFTITFVNTLHNHARILQSHSLPLPHPPGLHIRLAHLPDGLPPDHNRMADLSVLSRAIDTHMAAPFTQLMQQLLQSQPPVTCIFSDVLMLFTQDVANELGIPRVAVWLQSAASYTVNLHVPLLIREGHIPVKAHSSGSLTKQQELITCIPGHPPLSPTDLPSFFQVEDVSDYLFQFKLRPFARIKEAKFVLINSFYELESVVLDALQSDHPVLPVGPFLPPAFADTEGLLDNRTGTSLWPEDNECLEWLDKQKPCSVLYISFGSIALLSAAQFQELALGLEASGQPLLWAIRPDLVQSITAGLPPSFQEKGNGRVYVTDWAPQFLVLSHPSVGGFLTHCGWNSTIESISLGIPMLEWPYFADQMLNRKWAVEEWQVGKRFEAGEDGMVRKEEVERLVRLLMEGEEGKVLRERAMRLRDGAREAVREGGSSHSNLSKVLGSFVEKGSSLVGYAEHGTMV